jgi:hypothetical protein
LRVAPEQDEFVARSVGPIAEACMTPAFQELTIDAGD